VGDQLGSLAEIALASAGLTPRFHSRTRFYCSHVNSTGNECVKVTGLWAFGKDGNGLELLIVSAAYPLDFYAA
jgi:hypothetical protein